MSGKPSTIKCPKCGYQPNMLGDTCLQCGTKLEKLCGACGFANAVEKNYCDQCGAVLALQPPRSEAGPAMQEASRDAAQKAETFKLEMESIQDTVSERATSFRRKAEPPPPPPPPGAQPAKPPQQQPADPAKATSALSPDSSRLPSSAGLPHKVRPPLLKRVAGPAITLLLTGVLLGILYLIIAPSLPKLRLVMTAKSYLGYISQGKFERAYEMLSSNSKANITQEDYLKNSQEYYAKSPAWEFKDVQVFAMTDSAAMIRYRLKEGDSEWKDDYITFVKEHNRWMRPYIWILFGPIDEALKKHDFPQALFLAQKLYLTDPLDPRSSAFLCEAEFFMGLHEKAAESCKRTLDTAAYYPAGYVSSDLFQFHFHYADSLRFLQRDRLALIEYDKLLKYQGITQDDACPLHLNKADSYVYLKEYDRALQEVMAAAGVCTRSPSREDAQKRLRYMSGAAGPDAVAFAQKSRFQQGMPPIGEARALQLAEMKRRLGTRNARLMPRDEWVAVHAAGPEYRVFLRQTAPSPRTGRSETQDIFIFLINLWTGKAKVEKAPPAPPPPGQPPAGARP